jgi:flagellar biosynthesis chaperone FliJ
MKSQTKKTKTLESIKNMKNIFLTESQIKEVVSNIINESNNKVSRHEFSKVQFKLDDLNGAIQDAQKELRKLDDSVPNGLKNITNKKINEITTNLSNVKTLITSLKSKIYQIKKQNYSQPLEEKKK